MAVGQDDVAVANLSGGAVGDDLTRDSNSFTNILIDVLAERELGFVVWD